MERAKLLVLLAMFAATCAGRGAAAELPPKSLQQVDIQGDFAFLASVVDGVQIVGMGEMSHYTKECYSYKAAIIKYLVEKQQYNSIVFEVDYGEAKKWNDYVYHGNGNIDTILANCGWWTYRTQEFKDLLEFLRHHNQLSGRKVQVYGMEMTYIKHNIDFLHTYLQKYYSDYAAVKPFFDKERQYLAFSTHSHSEIKEYWEFYFALSEVLSMQEKFAGVTESEFDEVGRLVEILKQYCTYISQNEPFFQLELRDKFSMRNIRWVAEKDEQNKVIIWAHNAHIRRNYFYDQLGRNLSNQYGDAYFAIGFAFGRGEFGAFDSSWAFKKWTCELTSTPSLTNKLYAANRGDIFIDIRTNRADDSYSKSTVVRNDISEQLRESQLNSTGEMVLSETYDGMIFIRETQYPTKLKP